MNEIAHQNTHPRTPSRRKIIGATAWAAPAITLAVGAPALAASETPTPLPTQLTNLTVRSVTWNDGANGNNALILPRGAYYPANFPLYYDTVYENTGASIITGIQFSSSLEMAAHDFNTNPPVTVAIYKNNTLNPSSTKPRYNQDGRGLRWVSPNIFTGLTLAPGEKITFRTKYRTTTVRGFDGTAAPYGTAIVTAATPTAGFSTSAKETITTDNSQGVSNPYTVRT